MTCAIPISRLSLSPREGVQNDRTVGAVREWGARGEGGQEGEYPAAGLPATAYNRV